MGNEVIAELVPYLGICLIPTRARLREYKAQNFKLDSSKYKSSNQVQNFLRFPSPTSRNELSLRAPKLDQADSKVGIK